MTQAEQDFKYINLYRKFNQKAEKRRVQEGK